MDKKRVVLIWLIMASVIAVIAYLFGAAWWLAAIIGVVAVAAIVAGARYIYGRSVCWKAPPNSISI